MPDITAADLTGHDHRTLLHLFQHPLTHNLSLREVTSLFDTIGSAEEQHNGEIYFRLNGDTLKMQRPNDKNLSVSEVMDLRHLLIRQGWSAQGPSPDAPVKPEVTPGHAISGDMVIIIDHQSAQIYQLGGPDDPQNVVHEVKRSHHDADRKEIYPADTRFFELVGHAAATADRIVLIGHGKGQSNEADHLSDYLRQNHKDLHSRIVKEIVADLTHLPTHKLLELGRHALPSTPDPTTPNLKGE